jgi:CBS-domain-containing membrane protein
MKFRLIKDFMIPVDEYPRVKQTASIYEAMLILKTEQKKQPPAKPAFRAVLVLDDEELVVGKVGHSTFLKALEPRYKDVFDMDKLSRVQLSSNFIDSIKQHFNLWSDNIDLCHIAKTTVISEIMRPVEEHVRTDETLAEAIHKFLMWQCLSVLVTSGNEVVGILRLSDIYSEMENYILNCD